MFPSQSNHGNDIRVDKMLIDKSDKVSHEFSFDLKISLNEGELEFDFCYR